MSMKQLHVGESPSGQRTERPARRKCFNLFDEPKIGKSRPAGNSVTSKTSSKTCRRQVRETCAAGGVACRKPMFRTHSDGKGRGCWECCQIGPDSFIDDRFGSLGLSAFYNAGSTHMVSYAAPRFQRLLRIRCQYI